MGFIEEAAVYVLKYAPQFGIKVYSPILAQFILESASGTSELAVFANNIAGLKYQEGRCPSACGVYYKDGAEQNPDGSYTNSAMKWFKFPNMEAGVKGYFEFIDTPNYAKLKGVTDPRTYLEIIKASGFASSLNYVDNLMAIIDKYDLTKYDNKKVTTMATVFLSAGHGGNDPGATAFGLKEKDINLQTLLACKAELERHGVKVVASRLVDENDPVAQEVREANESGADIAVSFHVNAANGKADGFEAFYYKGSANGKRLAQICEKYVKELGQNSRGVKTNNLMFTRETKMTAVLVESFFIDNDVDNNIGDLVSEQKAFGVAYAKAILEYLGISYDGQTEATTDKLYRVQVGAYRYKENAEKLLAELREKGYSGFIV